MVKDYYAILSLTRTCSLDQIKSAYRSLALKLHPDVTQGDQIKERKFKEVVEAFEVLSNTTSRRDYDRNIGNSHVRYPQHRAASSGNARVNRSISKNQFNAAEWNAWHYGDNAVVTSSVKQNKNYMDNDPSPHKMYWEKQARRAEDRYQSHKSRQADVMKEQESSRDTMSGCCIS